MVDYGLIMSEWVNYECKWIMGELLRDSPWTWRAGGEGAGQAWFLNMTSVN